MQFKEIIGGNNIKNYLTEASYNKRLAHAYLFEGSENSPKLLFAFIKMKTILVENAPHV